jgi:hypothetical protein
MDCTDQWKKDCEKEGRGYGGSPSCRTEESGDFSFHKPRVADLSLHARLIDDQLQNHLASFLKTEAPEVVQHFAPGAGDDFIITPLPQDPSVNR